MISDGKPSETSLLLGLPLPSFRLKPGHFPIKLSNPNNFLQLINNELVSLFTFQTNKLIPINLAQTINKLILILLLSENSIKRLSLIQDYLFYQGVDCFERLLHGLEL